MTSASLTSASLYSGLSEFDTISGAESFPTPAYRKNTEYLSDNSVPENLLNSLILMKGLGALKENWDSLGGQEIPRETLVFSAELISSILHDGIDQPDIFPLPYGGVQIEWIRGANTLTLEIIRPNKIELLFSNDEQDVEIEETIDTDFSRIQHILNNRMY